MIIEVYDIEVLSNLFTYTGFDAKKKEWYQFVICEWRNDTNLLYNHFYIYCKLLYFIVFC